MRNVTIRDEIMTKIIKSSLCTLLRGYGKEIQITETSHKG